VTRKSDLAPPAEATTLDAGVITRLTAAIEQLSNPVDPELRCYTPAQAAEILEVSENWVNEAIRFGRIPCTYVGRFPRLTAAHIREIQEAGEKKPNRYSRQAA